MRKYLTYIFLLLPLLASAQQRITLEDCLQRSEEGNAALQGARLDIASARAQKNELLWSFFPSVNVTSFGFWSQDPVLDIGLTDIIGDSRAALIINEGAEYVAGKLELNTRVQALQYGWGVAATAVQPIFAGGRIINGNLLAAVGVEAAGIKYEIAKRDNREEVEKMYWDVVALQEKLSTVRHGKAVVDSLCKTVSAARRAGLVPESQLTEVLLQQQKLSSAEVALRGGLSLAKMNIFNNIGYPYEYMALEVYEFTEALDSLPLPVPPQDSIVYPESRLLAMQVRAKQLEKRVQVGEYLPQAGIGGAYGYSSFQGPAKPGTRLMAFATVKVPITGIGQAAFRAKRYEAQLQKAIKDKEYLDAQLALQERKMHLEMEMAYDQVLVAKEALKVASDGERRTKADYNAGRVSVTEWLKASVTTRGAYEEYIDKCIEYRKAYNAYCGRYR